MLPLLKKFDKCIAIPKKGEWSTVILLSLFFSSVGTILFEKILFPFSPFSSLMALSSIWGFVCGLMFHLPVKKNDTSVLYVMKHFSFFHIFFIALFFSCYSALFYTFYHYPNRYPLAESLLSGFGIGVYCFFRWVFPPFLTGYVTGIIPGRFFAFLRTRLSQDAR